MLVVLLIGVVGALFGLNAPDLGSAPGHRRRPSGDPARYLRLYQQAGQRYGIDPWILAAIGSIETNHGRSTAARRPLRRELRRLLRRADAVQHPQRATLHLGRLRRRRQPRRPHAPRMTRPTRSPPPRKYLRATGAPDDYQRALLAYNHAQWYVDQVLAKAREYRTDPTGSGDLPAMRASIWDLLRNRRLVLNPTQRADLRAGGFDPRLINTLAAIASRHTITITALSADHRPGTNHEAGRAIDIGAVDGEICRGARTGPCAQLVRELARVKVPARSTELIYCWDPDGPRDPRGFARADHCDHIHVGWDG